MQDLGDRGGAGVQGHVDADPLEQCAARVVADSGDDLRDPELFGDQGAEEIRLIVAGHGDQSIAARDADFLQHLQVGAVAAEDDRPAHLSGNVFTTTARDLDDPDFGPEAPRQFLRQEPAGAAAADDRHAAHNGFGGSEESLGHLP